MNQITNHRRPAHPSLSFEIKKRHESQANCIRCENGELSIIDKLKDQLGFSSRSTVLRWIFAQLEHENHLSRWTLEMLSKQKESTSYCDHNDARNFPQSL